MPVRNRDRAVQNRKPPPEDIKDIIDQTRETDFWLYVQYADVLIRYLEITMKRDSVISRLQGSALYFLLLNGGELTPTQLSGIMLRSKHSVTKIIDSLEKEGFVVRDFTSKDRRVTSIKLTDSGLKHLKQRFSKGNERAAKVMGIFNDIEQKTLADLTERMRNKMIAVLDSLSA